MNAEAKKERSRREEALRRNSVSAIRQFLQEPPVWTTEDVERLNRIIQEARLKTPTDFRNPLQENQRDLSPRNDDR